LLIERIRSTTAFEKIDRLVRVERRRPHYRIQKLARPGFETARDEAIQDLLIAECARISGVPFPS
jgi:hypothetical protein